MTFVPLDRSDLHEYNEQCVKAKLPKLNLVEANVLKAMLGLNEENEGDGASHDEVIEATGYTPGQVDHAITFLGRQGFLVAESS